MIVGRGRPAYVPAVVLSVLMLSCGGGSPSTPNTPTPTPPASTPIPGGGTGIVQSSCKIGNGSPSYECDRGKTSRLLGQVEAAMDRLIQQRPQIFDLEDEAGAGTRAYKVLDVDAYFDGVVANLVAQGLCAQRDLDDAYQQTIFVKESNEYSEEFDLILSSGYMRRGSGTYRTSCTPAAFPIERAYDAPPVGSGCFRPFPPPVTRFNCKLHLYGTEYYTLDSTPIVGPDVEYCAAVGFTDGRALCAVRPEGAIDRVACENWLVGNARDTGRPGPTWTKTDGAFCTGKESGCKASDASQYQLWVWSGGTYTVQGKTGSSCSVFIEK
jgi:hypothetical protein